MGHRRPEITDEHIEQIRQMMLDHPDWRRSRLSRELCELWGWKSEVGQLKDLSCRDLLRALDQKGLIKLPPGMNNGPKKRFGAAKHIQLSMHDTTPMEASLKDVAPVVIEIADSKDRIGEFKSLIEQHHYLAYGQSVGECMRYMVRSRDGIPLACLMFGSSAWRCAPRDRYIGWDDETRAAHLHFTSNNTRTLILPWIRIPCLASHVLSLVSRRISGDWQGKYGHPLYFLETYIERSRFAGTCFKAANWQRVGETTGRGRDSKSSRATLPIKDVYVYPLVKDFRRKLTVGNNAASGNGGAR
jgi:hypothetical protein